MSNAYIRRGPDAQQANIAAAGVAIANISATVQPGKTGNCIIIASCGFTLGTADEQCELVIRKNGVAITNAPAATGKGHTVGDKVNTFAIRNLFLAPADVIDLFAKSSSSTAEIEANGALLEVISLPPTSAFGAQLLDTP